MMFDEDRLRSLIRDEIRAVLIEAGLLGTGKVLSVREAEVFDGSMYYVRGTAIGVNPPSIMVELGGKPRDIEGPEILQSVITAGDIEALGGMKEAVLEMVRRDKGAFIRDKGINAFNLRVHAPRVGMSVEYAVTENYGEVVLDPEPYSVGRVISCEFSGKDETFYLHVMKEAAGVVVGGGTILLYENKAILASTVGGYLKRYRARWLPRRGTVVNGTLVVSDSNGPIETHQLQVTL